MKNRIIILLAAITASFSIGCSYVSDMVEGAITDRASFTIKATYSAGQVNLSWDSKSVDDDYFAGIEIYRTSEPNDEYSEYITVDDRIMESNTGYDLENFVTSYIDTNLPAEPGIYFYRVGLIEWEDDPDEREYTPSDSTYSSHTNIGSISGYAEVTIP